MPTAKITQNPSPYNALSFHLLRLAQFVSAAIVTSVVCFFGHYLLVEHYNLPWTFIVLLAAALVTIVTLLASSALYHFRTLSPRHNLILNTALSCLWILGLSFLTWNLGWTLGHRCLLKTWHNEAGIMVCRLYKACTAFTVMGLLSTLLALALDIRTHRGTTHLGHYNRMNEPLDVKRSPPSISSPMPQYPPYSSQRADDSMMTGDLSEYRVQREEFEVQHFRNGYEAPSEQTKYDPGHEGRF
ncbi:MAG: hypothetical protein LQ352_005026 [Teloschistes flavicans]|nr:MAG: hypothetical protein LQ352_005026 [Teloschistes flavicans]